MKWDGNPYGNARSLLFRFGAGSGASPDTGVPLESLVPKSLKRALIPPHWRSFETVSMLMQEACKRNLPVPSAIQVLEILRRAAVCELETINHQLRGVAREGQSSSVLHYLGLACIQITEALDHCIAVIREGSVQDYTEAVARLRKGVEEHEALRELLVSIQETQGWLLLERFSGPFSPLVSVLGWGMALYLSGLSSEGHFRNQLSWVQGEFKKLCREHAPKFFCSQAWKQAQQELEMSLESFAVTLLAYGQFAGGSVDPLILRGTLGMLAKAAGRLNALSGRKSSQAFNATSQNLVDRKGRLRRMLSFPPDFFPKATGLPRN